jgi:hypothetical protein
MADSILDPIFSGADGLAKTLIGLLGGDASITPGSAITYNPLDGSQSGVAGTPVPVDLSMLENVVEKDLENTNVVMGDYKGMVPHSDYAFTRDDVQRAVLTFNNTKYKVVWYNPIFSGQEIAFNTIFVRRV